MPATIQGRNVNRHQARNDFWIFWIKVIGLIHKIERCLKSSLRVLPAELEGLLQERVRFLPVCARPFFVPSYLIYSPSDCPAGERDQILRLHNVALLNIEDLEP